MAMNTPAPANSRVRYARSVAGRMKPTKVSGADGELAQELQRVVRLDDDLGDG
jgi:hypothetical protein